MEKTKTKKIGGGSGAFVLMIGDEGAILVQTQRKRVVRRLFAQSPDPMHTRAIDDALTAAPRASITLLIDMMDQSYVRQTLPPVSSFSVSKIIQRRLDKDFSPDDIKGYKVLDREKTGRKDWNFLMVSLANSPLLQKWIAFATERSNPFKGIGLLPLETQLFILAAEKALYKGKDKKEITSFEWQMLVSHNKVGGFRQVVLRNGKLVFTRMAIPIGESLPAVIAGNIEQEMTNTLEYLKRLGLQDTTALSATIMASGEIKEALDPKKINAREYHFFTPYEMGNLLSLPDAAQPEDHFGDVVISAFIAKQGKLLLPLHTGYTKKLRTLSRAIMGARLAGIAAALCILAWVGTMAADILSAQDSIEDLHSQHQKLVSALDDVKTKAKSLPAEINFYTDVVTMAKLFDKRRYDPLAFVENFAATLQNAALVTDYHWALNDPLSMTKDADKRQMSAEINLHLTSPRIPVDQYIAAATALAKRIENAFSEFDVSHSELPGLLADSQELKTVIDENGNTPTPVTQTQTDKVSISIKGPLEESKRQNNKHGISPPRH